MNENESNIPASDPQIAVCAAPSTASAPHDNPALESDLIDIEHFAKVQLRVAEIVSAEAVPKSKKLLKLQVNLGEKFGNRQILSGIAQFYSPESLAGKRIIVVANLKPAKLMGLESQGMLLAGSSDDSSVLAILEPSEQLPIGSLVR